MPTQLTDAEFGEQVLAIEHSALRLELQRQYLEPVEAETLAKFTVGIHQEPTELDFMQAWFDRVRCVTSEGKRIERVRVHDEPPTTYQRWERWIGAWNIAAGERMFYLTRARAHEIGLLPAAGTTDWWLLDSNRLIVMNFDDDGRRISTELTTDPTAVQQACAWWDLAVHHGVLEEPTDAVTT